MNIKRNSQVRTYTHKHAHKHTLTHSQTHRLTHTHTQTLKNSQTSKQTYTNKLFFIFSPGVRCPGMFTNTNHPPSQSPPEVTRIKSETHTHHKPLLSFPSFLRFPNPCPTLPSPFHSLLLWSPFLSPELGFSSSSFPNSSLTTPFPLPFPSLAFSFLLPSSRLSLSSFNPLSHLPPTFLPFPFPLNPRLVPSGQKQLPTTAEMVVIAVVGKSLKNNTLFDDSSRLKDFVGVAFSCRNFLAVSCRLTRPNVNCVNFVA